MTRLTPRQAEILALIRHAIETRGMPPTRTEIARELGFRSPNAAEDHLRALARKGVIELLPGASRGIRLTGRNPVTPAIGRNTPEPDDPMLPLVGRVAAGSPILAEAHIEARYRVDPRLFQPRADYLLRVRGDSMIEAGILDGDCLAVHRTVEARDGQIVVARLDDEVTVKRFRRRGNQVSLLPENADFEPIEVDLRRQALVIEGLSVGVIRGRLPV